MRPFLKQIFLGMSVICTCPLHAQEESEQSKQAIAVPNLFFSSDSEGFSTYKYRAAYIPLFEHGEKNSGISYQHHYFTQGGWDSSAEVYTIFTKSINPRTALGYNLNVGYNLENGHKVITTDSNFGFRVTDLTKAELMLNRDRVETQNSLNNGIYYTLAAVSIEQQLAERLSAIMMAGNMYFSDSNMRPLVRARLIYDLIPDYGVTAQIRYRQYRDTNINLPNNYFNPSTYNESMGVLGIRKRISGWVLSGTAGVGRQSVNQDPSTTTQLYEMTAISPVSSDDYYFKTRVGYGKSAGFQGPNYFYRYIMEELVIPF